MKLHVLPRHVSLGLVACVCLVLLAALPPNAALASYVVPKPVTNDVPSYADGSFQRTQLSTLKVDGSRALTDKAGATQLVPIGMFKFQDTPSAKPLPYQLIRMGVATVGNRVFVIGGTARGNYPKVNPTVQYNDEPVEKVWSATIDPVGVTGVRLPGDFAEDWQEEPSLNAVKASNQDAFSAPTRVVSSPAVTSVTIGGKSYIYVIGGNTRLPTTSVNQTVRDFSSYAVQVATVGSNGRIAKWDTLSVDAATPNNLRATIPPVNEGVTGLQGASAVSMIVNGSAYVYLIGGLQRYLEGGTNLVEIGSRAVFWAKVDPATGRLLKPSAPSQEGWDRMSNDLVPQSGGNPSSGVWDATAVANKFNINTADVTIDKVIYLFGGQTVSSRFAGAPQAEYSSKVHQIYIGDDGTPSRGDWQTGTLPETRFGLAGVTFGGKHYLTGGFTPSKTPAISSNMLTTYVQDDLTFPEFGGQAGANFLKDDNAISPRAFHGMALVPSGESAFVYVIGGQTSDLSGSTPSFSDEIFFGRVGGVENVKIYGFPKDGWYYSKPMEITFRDAEIQEIAWGTLITPTSGLDIQMYYRTSLDNNCSAASWTVSDWKPLDVDATDGVASKNGDNIYSLPPGLKARCFQYRAQLSSAGVGGQIPKDTPSLLFVTLKVLVPGSPDLRADQPGDIQAVVQNGNLTAFNVRIRNHNDKADLPAPNTQPTLSANAMEDGGSFFVDLYIYKQGEAATAPTIPIPGNAPNDIACASIPKSDMGPDTIRQISDWHVASANTDCNSGSISLLKYFADRGPGKYTVYLVIDSTCGDGSPKGCVDETDASTSASNGEGNNVVPYTFEYTNKVTFQQRFPTIIRK